MKKEYRKPILLVESFQLDAAVAAVCSEEGGRPLNHSIGDCWDNTEDKYIFSDDLACGFDATIGDAADPNDSACYHGPELGVTFIYS